MRFRHRLGGGHEARAADWGLDEFTVSPHQLIRALPRRRRFRPALRRQRRRDAQRRPHAGRYPDIRWPASGWRLCAGLRRRARAGGRDMKIVQIQDPRLPPAMFDALVVPRHDARGPMFLPPDR